MRCARLGCVQSQSSPSYLRHLKIEKLLQCLSYGNSSRLHLMFLGSPIPDLLGLIGIATDRPFREQYYDKLIDLYYTQLSNAFIRMDIDPEETYSRDDFYDEVKEKVLYGLVAATFVLPFITIESEKAPELKAEMSLDSLQITQVGPLYTGRMRDIVSDYVRWGALTF